MLNKPFCLIGIVVLIFFSRPSSAQVSSPLLNRVINTPYNLVYDTKAWSLQTGAAVRSTPLIKNGIIYFGNAKGDFFAVNQKTGLVKWKYKTGSAIHSSASTAGGKIFFADNKQVVYALDEKSGRLVWMFKMGEKIAYPWRFDYYQSSPSVIEQDLLIGGDDGFLYRLNQATGKLVWKYEAKGLVRSTPAIYKNSILFGDTEASFYAVDSRTGKLEWEYKITGDSINNENYGYDKRAVTSSATVSGNKVVFGSRDAYLYCLDADNGSLNWKITHEPSWIISTVAIKDSFVITGTSDGRFVQALHLETGKELWKYHTALAVWASPLINNDKVYTGGFDGQLLCLDLKTGKRISQFTTNGIIFSSPVLSDSLLYFGSDDGNLYALKGRKSFNVNPSLKKFVYHNNEVPLYFKGGGDERIKRYLVNNGFKLIAADTLTAIFSDTRNASNTAIVVAASYLPKAVWENGKNSLLRKFLDSGGRLILTGDNLLFFDIDDKTKDINGLSIDKAAQVFDINFGANDTRAFGGLFPSFPSEKGKEMGLPDQWISNFGINEKEIDIVLGKNENGLTTSFVKKYNNNGCFVQIYMSPELPMNMDAIIKLSESNF